MQGQILSARHGWRWLSAGQLLRDTHDAELIQKMQDGSLVDENRINEILKQALLGAKDLDHVILDGYPRQLTQAKWLIDTQPEHEHSIDLVIILEVPKAEILRRLKIRGRADDTPEAIEERLRIYRSEIYPILDYFNDQHITITHIDGTGTIGQVHDRIEEELVACKLV